MTEEQTDEITPNTIRVIKCASWDEFITKVRTNRFVAERVFRGQRSPDWKLCSKWERWLLDKKASDPDRNVRGMFAPGAYEAYRDMYLERFKQLAIGVPGFSRASINGVDEWWALARHHGLITPLLDWSQSPYVAAFFAFMTHAENLNPGLRTEIAGLSRFGCGSVAVWELATPDELVKNDEFDIITSRIDFAHRQKAQRGVFTRLTHDVHVDVESYLIERGLGHLLGRYEIPEQDVSKALKDLLLMNVCSATIMPDLDGAAAEANLWGSFDQT